MTIATILVGLLGYVYQILVGRLLTPQEFALFSSVMALGAFLASPMNALFNVMSRAVSVTLANGRGGQLAMLYRRFHLWLGGCAVLLVAALALVLGERFLELVRSSDSVVLWMFVVSLVCGMGVHINNAFFQGARRFVALAGAGLGNSAIKIASGFGLISLGLGVHGALGSVICGSLAVWLAGALYLSRIHRSAFLDGHSGPAVSGVEGFSAALVANVCFSAMTQLDMVVVNYFFLDHEAGTYAAAAVLGKAILYLPGGVVMALFPVTVEKSVSDPSALWELLLRSLAVTFALCLSAAVFYWVIGEWLLVLFFGGKYPGAYDVLVWYGFAMIPMALVLVAEHYLIARGRAVFAWIFLLVAPCQVGAVVAWHDELWMVVVAIGLSGSVTLAAGLAYVAYTEQTYRG